MKKFRRFLPFVFLLITVFILCSLLYMQQAFVAFPAKIGTNQRVEYLSLNQFNSTNYYCRNNLCQNEAQKTISFPLRHNLINITNITQKSPTDTQTSAILEYVFSDEELNWLKEQKEVYLYFPRMVHNTTRILEPTLGEFTAYGADFYAKTSDTEFVNSRLLFEINFTNLPWFGPADLPIFIVPHDGLASIQEKIAFQQFTGQLNKQFDIGLPLLILVFCLFFNHKKIFVLLSLLSTLKALRSFLAYVIDFSAANPIVEITYLIVVFLFLPAFVYYLNYYFSFRDKHFFKIASFFLVSFSALYFYFYSSFFLETFDLFVDAFNCLVGLFLILFLIIRNKNKSVLNLNTAFNRQNVELLLLILIFASSAYSNISDLIYFNLGLKPNGFSIGHYILFPGLFSAMLIRYGGVWRQMQDFAHRYAQAETMQNQFELAYKYQHSLLPAKKQASDKYSWRTFFWPGYTIGGDWLSIKNISNTKEWILATVVDVTGQGVASAMQSGIIANAIINAIKQLERDPEFEQLNLPQEIISLFLRKLELSYNENSQNLKFSSVFVVIDVEDKQASIANFSHPGVVHLSEFSLRYFPAKNSFFTAIRSHVVLDHVKIDAGNRILLFSDGFLPSDVSLPLWLQDEFRKCKESQCSFMSQLLIELRKRRRSYRKRHEKAAVDLDDAAAIQISLN
ncbi:MAG: SpoIIE family protein phosphatase [Oligoflexales bacterium]|nr:SpoIIE family protein phosphatase [Oligoflexales bacterium]